MSIIKTAWAFCDNSYLDKETTTKIPEDAYRLGFFAIENDYMDVYQWQGKIFFILRGSDDLEDWIDNCGFMETFKESASGFYAIVKIAIANHRDIYFTGHSRGGALATFLAEYCAYLLQKPCSCITFGSPRPERKKFRDHYNKLPIDHTNIFIKGDIIATSLTHYALGFRHVGKCIELDASYLWQIKRMFGGGHRRHELTKQTGKAFE